MVGAGAGTQLLDDRVDDGVGRHRARQALEDPREALGLDPPSSLEGLDGAPMTDAGEPDDDGQCRDRPVDEVGLDDEPEQDDQPENEEGDREDEP